MLVKVLTLTAILVIGAYQISEVQAQAASVTDQHLVLFEEGIGIPSDFAAAVATLGGKVIFSHAGAGVAVVEGLSNEAATQLRTTTEGLIAIERDNAFKLDPIMGETAAIESAIPRAPGTPINAFFYLRQWNMRAIHADQAWAAGRLGSPDVTVAILDTGIDYTYPDLVGRVDLNRSVSFVPTDDDLVDLHFTGKNYITDLNFHGTHVASTVVSNSNIIAGVTTYTTLMGVKVCDVEGSCPWDSIIRGVLYAADQGADVANMSLGGAFVKAGSDGFVGFINRLFNYAYSRGMTIVVAAGNATKDLDHDGNAYQSFCSTPNTICVSATGPTTAADVNGPWTAVDTPAYYTNFGSSAINVAAPGGSGGINRNVWAACSQTSLVMPICQTGTYILALAGTSMATPHVSGLAALIVEGVGRKPGQVRARIQQSADDLGKKGVDPYYGKGRINVFKAVQ